MTAFKEAKVIWQSGLAFEGTVESGFSVRLDTIAEEGGGTGFSPMELVLVGLAGCTAMDVISILKKKRQDVGSFEVLARGLRADDHPRSFTDITLEFVVHGRNIDPKAVERSIELSRDKYCSVMGTLRKVPQIKTTFRVEETA